MLLRQRLGGASGEPLQIMTNPIETFLDLEPGSTPTLQDAVEAAEETTGSALIDPSTGELVERKTSEVAVTELDREERIEDLRIDAQLGEIHSAAMQAFYQQSALAQQVDPKFSARNAEVAAQFLTTALNTVNSRVDAKYKRQKVRIAQSESKVPHQVQNNVIVTDRNSLLKQLFADHSGLPNDPSSAT